MPQLQAWLRASGLIEVINAGVSGGHHGGGSAVWLDADAGRRCDDCEFGRQ
jgi:hypothetical protein